MTILSPFHLQDWLCLFRQHDGTARTANNSLRPLRSVFNNTIIIVALCPPRSPDLNGREFNLWGILRNKAHVNNSHT